LGPIGSALFNFKGVAVLEVFAESVDSIAECAIGLALIRLIRTDLEDEIVEHVTQVHGVQHAGSEIDGELQTGLAGGGFDAIAVFKQQDAETIEAGVLQRVAVFGFIHAKAAWTAGSRGKEDEVVENLLPRKPFFFKELQVLHQVSDGKVRRIALAIVAKFLAGLEGVDVRHRELFAAVAAPLKNSADEVFVLPRKTTEEDGDVLALLGRKGALDRPMEMVGLIESSDLA